MEKTETQQTQEVKIEDSDTKPSKSDHYSQLPIHLGGGYDDEKDNLLAEAKTLWFLVLVLVIVIVMLLFSNNSLANKVQMSVDIPPKIYDANGKVDVSTNGANKLYYRLHGEYYLREMFDFTYENFPAKLNKLKSLMTPSRYEYKRPDFEQVESFVKNNMISQKLIHINKIHDVKIKDDKYAILNIDVTVEQTIGSVDKTQKDCSYKMIMYRQNWKLYALDYFTTCFDDFKKEQK